MTTPYERGATLERKVAAHLQTLGYYAARVAGSHTCADVIALASGWRLLVQCKRDGRVDPDEWNDLYDTGCRVGAVALVAVPGGCGRAPEYRRIVARKDGVRGRTAPYVPFDPAHPGESDA